MTRRTRTSLTGQTRGSGTWHAHRNVIEDGTSPQGERPARHREHDEREERGRTGKIAVDAIAEVLVVTEVRERPTRVAIGQLVRLLVAKAAACRVGTSEFAPGLRGAPPRPHSETSERQQRGRAATWSVSRTHETPRGAPPRGGASAQHRHVEHADQQFAKSAATDVAIRFVDCAELVRKRRHGTSSRLAPQACDRRDAAVPRRVTTTRPSASTPPRRHHNEPQAPLRGPPRRATETGQEIRAQSRTRASALRSGARR